MGMSMCTCRLNCSSTGNFKYMHTAYVQVLNMEVVYDSNNRFLFLSSCTGKWSRCVNDIVATDKLIKIESLSPCMLC